MMVVQWYSTRAKLTVHYQRPIDYREGPAQWSWGPISGAYLISISEQHALTILADLRLDWRVEGPDDAD